MNKSTASLRVANSIPSAELIVKNLRLLDFDEEFDWPQITSKTFAATDSVKNLNKRAYAAGWVYYKLFDLLEPRDTKNNLGLYFPPFDPKQSSLLRAAVFKRLNDLKNDGFFGKDVIVRKTMFDDCKGPNFEALLAVFSTAVILKVLGAESKDQTIAKRLLNKPTFDQERYTSLLVAYKATLSGKLDEREALGRRWHKFARLLISKDQELDHRALRIEQMVSSSPPKKIPKRTLDKLRKHMYQNWKGDRQWVDIMLRSDQHRPERSLLQRPFSEVWNYACSDTLYAIRPERNDSLLQCLENRVQAQRARLDQWKSIRDDMLARAQAPASEIHMEMTENIPPASNQKYIGRSNSGLESVTPIPRRFQERPSIEAIDTPSVSARRKFGHTRAQSEIVQTPLSSRRYGDNSQRPLANTSARIATPSQGPRSREPYSTSGEIPSYETDAGTILTRAPARSQNQVLGSYQDETTEDLPDPRRNRAADDIVSSMLNAQPTPAKPLLSLVERTRISLANTSPTKLEPHPPTPDTQYSRPVQTRFNSTDTVPQTPAPVNNLTERTRQSLSAMAFSAKPTDNRRMSKARPSSIYPVNQFQSPMKAISEPEPANSPTLDETDLDADYETIFKSRPRVAMSPVLKPTMEARDSMGSRLNLGDEEISYEDDFS